MILLVEYGIFRHSIWNNLRHTWSFLVFYIVSEKKKSLGEVSKELATKHTWVNGV